MDELQLDRGVPVLISTNGMCTTIQNSMPTNDDQLLISNHGDPDKAWIHVPPGELVKFNVDMYAMQNVRPAFIFPITTQ